ESTYLTEQAPFQNMTLHLRPSGAFPGRVVDTSGKPVPEALIEPLEAVDGGAPSASYAPLCVLTGADGAFVVPHLPAGYWRFLIQADGYPHSVTEPVASDARDTEFVLGGGGALTGKVVFSGTGQPVEGVEVQARAGDWAQDSVSVKTDAEGLYRFAALRPATYQLLLKSGHVVPAQAPPSVMVGEAQDISGIDILVVESGGIAGTVRDAATSLGIPDIQVNAHAANSPGSTSVKGRTGASGEYAIEGLGAGDYRLVLDAPARYLKRAGSVTRRVALKAGEPLAGIDFELTSTPEIAGICQDTAGTPVPEAQVHALPVSGLSNWARTFSDGEGRFRLAGFEPGTKILIAASTDTMESAQGEGLMTPQPVGAPDDGNTEDGIYTVGEDGLRDVVIVLDVPKTAGISGVVVDQAGNPAPGLGVQPSKMGGRSTGGQEVTTGEDGAFSVSNLAAGTYRLGVRIPKFDRFESPVEPAEIVLAEGERKTDVRVVMNLDEGLSIAGRVTNAKGEPVARAYVFARDTEMKQSYGGANTDSDGRYRIVGLKEGPHVVQVSHPSSTPVQREDVNAGVDNADFVLDSPASIEGRVLNAQDRSAIQDFEIGYYVGKKPKFGLGRRAQTVHIHDVMGRFQLPNVPAGDVTLVVQAPGFAPAEHETPVSSGQLLSGVEVLLGAGLTVEGTVLDNEGKPIGDARVYVKEDADSGPGRVRSAAAVSGPDGRFTLDALPQGDAVLEVMHDRYAPALVPVTGAPGEHVAIEVVLGNGGRIEGRVTLDGQPVLSAMVTASRSDMQGFGAQCRVQTDDDGRYLVEGLSDGEYIVEAAVATVDGATVDRTSSTSAIVGQDQVTVVDFALEVPNSFVEGTITESGNPVLRASVSAQIVTVAGAESLQASLESEDGTYRIGPFPAGHVTLKVRTGGRQKVVELDVADGSTARQDVAFEGAASLSGVVTGLTEGARNGVFVLSGNVAPPKAWTRAALNALEPYIVNNLNVKADGAYRAANIEPGVYTILAYSAMPDGSQARFTAAEAVIEAGQDVVLDLSL
ncbi:MAG: Carboxypeptidase regulatory-like protein, partial [Candidatus Hydrogenedentes bacterium]|nr:Carboxypeptidase regulatory-like protein [Candidatus Hydrogenedentota bacterium]